MRLPYAPWVQLLSLMQMKEFETVKESYVPVGTCRNDERVQVLEGMVVYAEQITPCI